MFFVSSACNLHTHNKITVTGQLTEDLRRIADWWCANILLINPDKTELLLLGTRQMLHKIPDAIHVTLLGKQIYPFSSAKDLEIRNYNRCKSERIKFVLDRQTLVTIIKALVISKLYYCSSAWANSYKRNLKKLQHVQNFAARIITGTKRHEHILPALPKLNWLPIHLAVQYLDTVMAFKCVKSVAPPYLCKKFRKRFDVRSVTTRNSNLLNIPSFKSASSQRSFHYQATKLWIVLPEDMKHLQLASFEQKLKSLLWEDFSILTFNFYSL